jgi:NAD(P)-dependent dehydrogenase (short-subunit alcohol dehydrogenase family)
MGRLLKMAKQRMIVIGGITGGIGSSLAGKLLAAGHRVSGFGRDPDRIEAFNREHDLECEAVDATDPDSVATCLQEIAKAHGGIDAYVHAIGSIFLKPAHLTSPENWAEVMQTNLFSAFYALRACAPIMQKQGEGSCLFFSTAAAQIGISNHEAIAAAKGGIEAMVRSAAATYSSKGIRFNAIAPSLTDTPLAKPIIGSEQALEISKRMHPLGQIGEASDIASLAAWLISDEAKFVTGQTFTVDGGISTVVPKPKA